jgi:hypothetical protein
VPPAALGLVVAAPLFGLALLAARPRVRRKIHLDEQHDVSLLLKGALARPEAFDYAPALFERALVPRRGGGSISLVACYRLAAEERLYCSDAGAPLSERAVKAGAVVLDAMRPEGRVVADALGAVNLDHWDRLMRTVETSPLIERANELVRGRGERWMLLTSPELRGEPRVLRVPGGRDERWVVVSAGASWLTRAEQLAVRRPARAVFDVVDHATAWLRIPSARRARLLAPLARELLEEESQGGAS